MADSSAQTIARAVRARRLELRLSTDEASARARIPEKSWRLIEDGLAHPSDLMLGALCRALEWTPATIESLLQRELRVNGDGEMVVDLDASEQPDASAAPITLNVEGLSPAQLYEVQDYIDYLRARFS